jgi:hypothetical protein
MREYTREEEHMGSRRQGIEGTLSCMAYRTVAQTETRGWKCWKKMELIKLMTCLTMQKIILTAHRG